jgi:hypothetical protein
VTWRSANAKVDKESISIFKQTVNISKEDMEDYNFAMFTHAMDFFRKCVSLRSQFQSIFYQLTQQFVDKGLGNTWELVIHEFMKP